MTDTETVTRLRTQVLTRLTERRQTDRAAGLAMMRAPDEQALGRHLIAEVLEAHARDALAGGRPVLSVEDEDNLAQAIFDSLFRLDGLQRLLDDPAVENINANGADVVWVRYADGRHERVAPIADSDDELVELLRTAAARMGLAERRFDLASPRLALQLPDGSRLFAVMAVAARPCVSVRRHRYLKITPDDLIPLGTLDVALREFCRAATLARKCLVICGGTGVGKTTLLRALAADIPAWERLITIEDSLELGLDRYPELHPDVVALEAREPNVEGQGGISLAELVRWALRMSPDRVIVGEARGEEVLALLNAMSQGTDGSMATLHSSSSKGAFTKLATYAVQAPERCRHRSGSAWRRPTCWWPAPWTSSSSSTRTPPGGASSPRCARSSTPTGRWWCPTRCSAPARTAGRSPALRCAPTPSTS
jgi:pilus assembly protein CpaF